MIHIQKLHDPQIEVHDSMIEAHGAVSSDRFHELCSSSRNTRDYSHGELRTKPAGESRKILTIAGRKTAENSRQKIPVEKEKILLTNFLLNRIL